LKTPDPAAQPPTLQRAKITPPAAFNRTLERPRILKLLEQGSAARVNLVHGPAGFGKTTLLRQAYLARPTGRVAWITFDAGDNDPGRLLFHLAAAIGHPFATASHTESAFDNLSITADHLVELQRAFAELPADFCLFFDDVDALTEHAALETIRSLIQSAPPETTFILGARAHPELPLGRLRMHGALQEIDANLLRFSRSEIEQLLRHEVPNEPIDPLMVDRLAEVTEGWIGSIQMAVMSLKSTRNKRDFLLNFSGSNTELADYLAEDLLARQSRELKDFLIATSVLDQLSPELCDWVLQREGSAAILEQLVKANMFLFSIGTEPSWYRYHGLFRDFLLNRARVPGDANLGALRKRAALWFSEHGRPAAAIHYALASDDFELATDFIDESVMPFFFAGRLITIAEWVRPLPTEIRNRYPRIMVAYAWSLLALQQKPDTVTELVTDLERRSDLPDDLKDEVLYLGPFHAGLCDNLIDLDAVCAAALDRSPRASSFSRGVLWNIITYVRLHKRDFAEAVQSAREARNAHLRSGSAYGLVVAECFGGAIELERGRLRSARAICETARANTKGSQNEATPAIAVASLDIRLLYETNRLDELSEQVDRFGRLIVQLGTPREVIDLHEIAAKTAFVSGNYTEACRILNELRQLGRLRPHRRMVATGWALQAQMAARRGDIGAASDYFDQASECSELAQFGGEIFAATKAVIDLASGRTALARVELDEAIARAERHKAELDAHALRLLRIELHLVIGDSEAAGVDMQKTLNFIVREGALRAALHAPANVRCALAAFARESMPRSDCGLLDQLDAEGSASNIATPVGEGLPLVLESLSVRELDVLKLVSKGLSNQSIADRLYISLATVKTHLRNINAKLYSANRTEAVAVARQHSLIQ
jgi:LuxR family maltose regulon positive regulatory protein